MDKSSRDKAGNIQQLLLGRDRALLTSAGAQRILPFDDAENRVDPGPPSCAGDGVACMFADEFRVLEMRREPR